jgi:hypothetical protein
MRSGVAQETTASLDQLKVAYTLNFLELVRWEEEGATFEFCVYSSSAVGDLMMTAVRGRKIRSMQITARMVARGDSRVGNCSALFIPAGTAPDVPDLLKRLKGSATLTISDIRGFASAGGIIGFVLVGNRLRFDINERAAAQSKLKVSARLLELANNVIRG